DSMTDASHKDLYKWENRKKYSASKVSSKKYDDIKVWLREVEHASTNAVETVFSRSSGKHGGKILADKCAEYAKTNETAYSEAREILDEWVQTKLRLEAGLDDSDDDEQQQLGVVRAVKEACNLSMSDEFNFIYDQPKDIITFNNPSLYYETHDEVDLVKDILHDLRTKDVINRQNLKIIEQTKPETIDIQTKIELRHQKVKENHEQMQREREIKKKQIQAKKEAETQARLLILKEERERALKAKQEEEEIERHVISIRKEMNEKRYQDDEQRKQYREFEHAKLERIKAEDERQRKEEELQKLKEISLKEQQDLKEKKLSHLVEDFIRMKGLTILQKNFSSWLNVVLDRRIQMGRAAALADWKLLFRSFNWWRSTVRTTKVEQETVLHVSEMQKINVQMQKAINHYDKTLLRRSMINWQIYIRNELIAKNLQHEQQQTKQKINAFLEAATTGRLWSNTDEKLDKPKMTITGRKNGTVSQLSSRTRSTEPSDNKFHQRPSTTSETNFDIKLDDFFQTPSQQQIIKTAPPMVTDTRRMHLDFEELSSSDEDESKKRQREKRIKREMAEHKSSARVLSTFENRYKTQMKMLNEQNRLLKEQQRMIAELKFNQDQQSLRQQISNLEELKAQQTETEQMHRKQLTSDRRHATAIIHAFNNGELKKRSNSISKTLSERSNEADNIQNTSESQTNRTKVLDLSSISTSSKQTEFVKNMEERAKRRQMLKTEREEKRRQIEDEKLAKVQTLMEEKRQQEEEEKRVKAEQSREKRRMDKEREEEKKRLEERLKTLNEKADAHY
ncbi:unnamed protein product, partial [Didymodactylos carnosus]